MLSEVMEELARQLTAAGVLTEATTYGVKVAGCYLVPRWNYRTGACRWFHVHCGNNRSGYDYRRMAELILRELPHQLSRKERADTKKHYDDTAKELRTRLTEDDPRNKRISVQGSSDGVAVSFTTKDTILVQVLMDFLQELQEDNV